MTATPKPEPLAYDYQNAERRAHVRAEYDFVRGGLALTVLTVLVVGEDEGIITAEQSSALLAIFERTDTADEIRRTWRGVVCRFEPTEVAK